MFDRITAWWNTFFIRSSLKEPLIYKREYTQPIPGLLDVWKRADVRQACILQAQRRPVSPSDPEMK